MTDKNRTTKWINGVLDGISDLDDNQGIEIMHACGRECSKMGGLLEGAKKIRSEFPDDADAETLFRAFKKRYYDSPLYTKEGNVITLIFEECTCPMVKEGVSHPFLCNCTIGYSKIVLETLFDRPVKVQLVASILKGDDICKQVAVIKEE